MAALSRLALCITLPLAGPEVYANHNAPPAVALSAVIYALRAMVDKDIPLNQVGGVVAGAPERSRDV